VQILRQSNTFRPGHTISSRVIFLASFLKPVVTFRCNIRSKRLVQEFCKRVVAVFVAVLGVIKNPEVVNLWQGGFSLEISIIISIGQGLWLLW